MGGPSGLLGGGDELRRSRLTTPSKANCASPLPQAMLRGAQPNFYDLTQTSSSEDERHSPILQRRVEKTANPQPRLQFEPAQEKFLDPFAFSTRKLDVLGKEKLPTTKNRNGVSTVNSDRLGQPSTGLQTDSSHHNAPSASAKSFARNTAANMPESGPRGERIQQKPLGESAQGKSTFGGKQLRSEAGKGGWEGDRMDGDWSFTWPGADEGEQRRKRQSGRPVKVPRLIDPSHSKDAVISPGSDENFMQANKAYSTLTQGNMSPLFAPHSTMGSLSSESMIELGRKNKAQRELQNLAFVAPGTKILPLGEKRARIGNGGCDDSRDGGCCGGDGGSLNVTKQTRIRRPTRFFTESEEGEDLDLTKKVNSEQAEGKRYNGKRSKQELSLSSSDDEDEGEEEESGGENEGKQKGELEQERVEEEEEGEEEWIHPSVTSSGVMHVQRHVARGGGGGDGGGGTHNARDAASSFSKVASPDMSKLPTFRSPPIPTPQPPTLEGRCAISKFPTLCLSPNSRRAHTPTDIDAQTET